MTAAILAPGPSLAHAVIAPADVVLAVNRSILFRPDATWFCAIDHTCIRAISHEIRGRPLLLTSALARESLARHGNHWAHAAGMNTDDLMPFCPVPSWTLYTATSALVLAAHLGATRVEVYGADWTDAADWDSVRLESCVRDSARWATERGIWDKLVGWMNEKGVEVNRV